MPYSGYLSDIWSMGVILFAVMTGQLPFSDDDTAIVIEKIKLGKYYLPNTLSSDAKDLITRILQTNPSQRITMEAMWHHPFVQKHALEDDYSEEYGQLSGVREALESRAVRPSEIDSQLVRQLRSLWHTFSEEELKVALASDELVLYCIWRPW